MKVIIAGGREFTDYELLKNTLRLVEAKVSTPLEIICGEARGADALGKRYAQENDLTIHSFPADWNTHGKSAGYKRNTQMAEFADGLIAFWDGKSKGTKHMIDIATRLKLKIIVVKY